MSSAPTLFRGWAFRHPDLPPLAGQHGLVLSEGASARVADADAVHQALTLLLTTRPGERVMRPTYGCDLFRLVFAPNDDTTAGLAIHYVREAIRRWEPRIRIVELDARQHPGAPASLVLELTFELIATGERGELTFDMALEPEGRP